MNYKSKWVYVVTVVILSIGLFGLLTGCPEKVVGPRREEPVTSEDGTITVRVTGADDHNGEQTFFAVVAAGDDLLDSNNHIAEATENVITGGILEVIMLDPLDPTETVPAIFTGGESYDVGGIIDVYGDADITIGVDYLTGPFRRVVVDGDMVVEFVYPTDFILWVDPIIGVWAGTWIDTGGKSFTVNVEYKADGTFTETLEDIPPAISCTFSGTYVHDSFAKTITINVTSTTEPAVVGVGYTGTFTYSLSGDTVTMTGVDGTGTFTRQ